MLGEVIYEETGTTSGIRVLSSEGGETTLEISLQTQGKILGVEQSCMWTYRSTTRSDGSIYGEGKGVMTTKDGDVIHLLGSGAAKSTKDVSVAFRGSIYFQTTAEKYAHLNTIAGVHEYEVDSEGNAVNKVWEWT